MPFFLGDPSFFRGDAALLGGTRLFIRQALLFGELAVALDIPMDSVPGYIADRLGNLEQLPE